MGIGGLIMENEKLQKITNLFLEKPIIVDDLFDNHPYDLSRALLELDEEQRQHVFQDLSAANLAVILEFVDEEKLLEIFEEMTPKLIVNIIQELDIDDAVDVINLMPERDRAGFLKLMDTDHQAKIRVLL